MDAVEMDEDERARTTKLPLPSWPRRPRPPPILYHSRHAGGPAEPIVGGTRRCSFLNTLRPDFKVGVLGRLVEKNLFFFSPRNSIYYYLTSPLLQKVLSGHSLKNKSSSSSSSSHAVNDVCKNGLLFA